jgi:hypothetical protein
MRERKLSGTNAYYTGHLRTPHKVGITVTKISLLGNADPPSPHRHKRAKALSK